MTLRISRLQFPLTTLGPGRRLGVWVQGCGLACPGCMSRDTWDRTAGRAMTVTALAAVWRSAAARAATGITVSGGEPLDQPAALAALLTEVRRDPGRPGTDILVYTGYEEGEAERRGAAVLALADAVITGRYDISRPTRLIWRGSANQRLIPRTALGLRRYGPYLDHEPDRPPMEIRAENGDLRIVGIPRAGDLHRVEGMLRANGITPQGVSWRPGAWAGPRRDAPADTGTGTGTEHEREHESEHESEHEHEREVVE